MSAEVRARLECLRAEIRAGRIDDDGLAELSALAEYVEPWDVELRQAACLPEWTGSVS